MRRKEKKSSRLFSEWGRVLTPSKALGTLVMEWYVTVSTQKNAADLLSKSNGFQAFPPCLKILGEEQLFKQ